MLPCGPFGFIHTFLASAMSLHISVHASYMMHTEHDQVYPHLLYLFNIIKIIAFTHNEQQSTLKAKKAPCAYNIKSAIHVITYVTTTHNLDL